MMADMWIIICVLVIKLTFSCCKMQFQVESLSKRECTFSDTTLKLTFVNVVLF